ncbi:MAG: DsbA family protein, partial [Gammaproteobacteria bacterium]|nr:DsbA family protein [Gammaproteobacteria bacterium]
MAQERVLWYFADPMCSWCWGFTPAISAIKESYSDRLKIALMLGGLRPGTTEPVTPKFREETLHHWRDVQRMTGQPFAFEDAMPEGFVYDTEPASRAVIAVAGIDPEATFPYF